jgi:hypothetical protein
MSTEAYLFSTASFAIIGERLGIDPANWSAGVLWVGSGALLLRSSGSVQIC